MPAPNEITIPQLNRLIGTPGCPVIVDICTDEDFAEDPRLIPTSIRHSYHDLKDLLSLVIGRSVVVACQKGKKLSQGVTSWLRSEGISAEYLHGGVQAWHDHDDTLSVPAASIPDLADGATLWVTRHRPKIDRIACPWLIRRFVDRNARFLYVAPSEVMSVADRFGATAFDAEGASFHDRGDRCTFDVVLDHFQLRSAALIRLADVVRAADLDNHASVPEAAGLHALSVGLSRQFKDDHSQLEQGLLMYDAFYRWARDGFDEQHKG